MWKRNEQLQRGEGWCRHRLWLPGAAPGGDSGLRMQTEDGEMLDFDDIFSADEVLHPQPSSVPPPPNRVCTDKHSAPALRPTAKLHASSTNIPTQ